MLLSTGMRMWTENILQFGNQELHEPHAVRKARKITKLQIDIVRAFGTNILNQCSIDGAINLFYKLTCCVFKFRILELFVSQIIILFTMANRRHNGNGF